MSKCLRPCIAVAFIAFVGVLQPVAAQSRSNIVNPTEDPRGPSELTICSQNLENYGSLPDSQTRTPSLSAEDYAAKETALLRRFLKAKCDVIAVQEVLGKSDDVAAAALGELARRLKRITNRSFAVKVGPTLDKFSHVGFLVAEDRASISTYLTYEKVELPKLTDKEVGSSRVDLQACKLEYSIVSPK